MDVLDYNDYRRFLRDFVEARRAESRRYSLSYYSRLIGASEGYLKLVVSGKRSLNLDKARLLAQKLKLKGPAVSYLMTLVMRDRARSPALARHYEALLADYRRLSLAYSRTRQHAAIFEDVLTWEIFSLTGLRDFRPDPAWIAAKLRRRGVTAPRVQKCLATLVRLGALVERDGRYVARDIVLPSDQSPKHAYAVALRRALEFLESDADGEPHFDAFCLILSEDEYAAVAQILAETRSRIASVVGADRSSKTLIAFLNMNLHRASR